MISRQNTRDLFDRNNIVSDQDLKEAVRKKQTYYEKQETTVEETKRGEVTFLKKPKANDKNILLFFFHKTGHTNCKTIKEGLGLNHLTPLFLVPRAGVEPARWGTTEGF